MAATDRPVSATGVDSKRTRLLTEDLPAPCRDRHTTSLPLAAARDPYGGRERQVDAESSPDRSLGRGV